VIDNHLLAHHDAPEAPFSCDFCNEGSDERLDRIEGKYVCAGCTPKHVCTCGTAFMLKGWNDCNVCLAAYYMTRRAEFLEDDSIGLFTGDAKQVGDKVRNAINAEMPSARKLLMDLHRTEQDRGNAAAAWDLIQAARWLESQEQRVQKVAR
jgi:hypothetical protein